MKRKKLGFCMPGYRWCGPGCSGPGAPTNDVDACCKLHDECYRRFGGPSAYCDNIFINCMRPKINSHTRKGRDAALFSNFVRLSKSLRSF